MSDQGFIQPDFATPADPIINKQNEPESSYTSLWNNHKEKIIIVIVVVILIIVGYICYKKFFSDEKCAPTATNAPSVHNTHNPSSVSSAPSVSNPSSVSSPSNVSIPSSVSSASSVNSAPNISSAPNPPNVSDESHKPDHTKLVKTLDDDELDKFINPKESDLEIESEEEKVGDVPNVESADESDENFEPWDT